MFMIRFMKDCFLTIGILSLIIVNISCNKESPHQNKGLDPTIKDEASELISQHGTKDVDGFILNKLKEHRIVIIGDGDHHHAVFQQRIISCLNKWIDEISKSNRINDNTNLPRNIVLMLEGNPIFVTALRDFMASGDVNVILLNYKDLNELSVPDIEFYHDLYVLLQKIDSLNKSLDKKIMFDIFGPEKEINPLTSTREGLDDFFVEGRDEYSADQVEYYLKQNPEFKSIVFYGNAHLHKHKALKIVRPSKRYGYYMAHYLKKKFVRDCYTICQYRSNNYALEVPFPIAYEIDVSRTTLFYKKSYLFEPSYSDAVILYQQDFENRPIVDLICSIPSYNIFSALISNLKEFRLGNNYLCDRYKRFSLVSLYFLSGKLIPLNIRNIISDAKLADSEFYKWESWLNSYNQNGVEVIKTLSLFTPYLEVLESEKNSLAGKFALEIMKDLFHTFFPKIPSITSDEPLEWKKHIQRYREAIIIPRLINFLWVGTPDERKDALLALQEETGHDLKTAKEWTVWWRKSYKSNY